MDNLAVDRREEKGNAFRSLGYALYLISLTSKLILWLLVHASPEVYEALVILNVIEACGWSIWQIKRFGARFGVVLLLLPLVSTLYSSVPVGLLAADFHIYPFSSDVLWKGFLLESLALTHIWAFSAMLFSSRYAYDYQARFDKWLQSLCVAPFGFWCFLGVGLVLSLSCVANFYLSGASSIVGTASRIEIVNTSETGKMWLIYMMFAAWLMVCTVLWIAPQTRKRFGPIASFAAFIAISSFLYVYLRLGNRTDLLLVFLFAFCVLCMRKRFRWVVLLSAIALPYLIYLGMVRGADSENSNAVNALAVYLTIFGEFIFPHYPLLDHLRGHADLWLGWSYLRSPVFFVPNFGLWSKPLTLATIFSRQLEGVGGMGYAYTPLAEGYANFGWFSIILVPAYLLGGLRLLASRFVKTPLPFLVVSAMSLAINRGEFEAIVMETVIITTMLGILLTILKFHPVFGEEPQQ